jgi:hypothetical protein
MTGKTFGEVVEGRKKNAPKYSFGRSTREDQPKRFVTK